MARTASLPLALLASLSGLAAPALTLGQTKPPPPEVVPAPRPELDLLAFRDAYERAGRPVILTLAGFSTGDREAASVEQSLLNTDAGGFAHQVRAAFNEFINPPEVDLDLVSPPALADAAARLKGVLDARRERESIELLAAQARADVVILIRFFGDATGGNPARAQLEVLDARGRERFSFPFQWNIASIDTPAVREVARLLAIAFTNDYARRVGPPSRWTLRVSGLVDAEATLALREQLEATRGLTKVSLRRGATGPTESFREFEATSALDALELETVVARALRPAGYTASMVSIEGGTINLKASPLKPGELAVPPVAPVVPVVPPPPQP